MTIQKIKREMLSWIDYYGQDIVQRDIIVKAKTKKELKAVMSYHFRFLEDQNIDALKHCDIFINKMGLDK